MKQKTAAILLAAFWTFAQASGVSAVLCVGDDGAVSVEPSIGSKCLCSGEKAAEAPEVAVESAGEPCQDIPLAMTALAKAQARFSMFAVASMPVLQAQATTPQHNAGLWLYSLQTVPKCCSPVDCIVLLI